MLIRHLMAIKLFIIIIYSIYKVFIITFMPDNFGPKINK